MSPFSRAPSEASITLKTQDDKRTLRLGRSVAASLQKENITNGDVVQIDAKSGKLERLGKAREDWEDTADLSVANLVPVPKGDVQQEKEFTHTLTLHHMDQINAKRSGRGLMSMFGMGESGVDEDIRNAVNEQVKSWIEEGKGELLPGVLFIDEVHMLDIETISFLNRAMEREFAPIMVLALNRSESRIRGTDLKSPHGLPLDLLDRLLIIDTKGYDSDEIEEIIKIRAEEGDVELKKEALEKLAEIGEESSMRYAVQLMAPANNIDENEGNVKVTKKDVEKARELFIDVKRSSKILEEYEDRMMS